MPRSRTTSPHPLNGRNFEYLEEDPLGAEAAQVYVLRESVVVE